MAKTAKMQVLLQHGNVLKRLPGPSTPEVSHCQGSCSGPRENPTELLLTGKVAIRGYWCPASNGRQWQRSVLHGQSHPHQKKEAPEPDTASNRTALARYINKPTRSYLSRQICKHVFFGDGNIFGQERMNAACPHTHTHTEIKNTVYTHKPKDEVMKGLG